MTHERSTADDHAMHDVARGSHRSRIGANEVPHRGPRGTGWGHGLVSATAGLYFLLLWSLVERLRTVTYETYETSVK